MSKEGIKKTQDYRKPRRRVKLEERGGVIGKECTECAEWKPLELFVSDKRKKTGKGSWCLACKSDKSKRFRADNPEYAKKYYKDNKERIQINSKIYRESNQSILKHRKKIYREENIDSIKEKKRIYYTVNRERIKRKSKDRYEKNKFEILQRQRLKRKENPEKTRLIKIKEYENNKEKYQERARLWRENNPERKRFYDTKRRAMKSLLPSNWGFEERCKTWDYFGNSCALTSDKNDITDDHAIPLVVGHGGTVFGNMYPLAGFLNSSKQDSNIFEWFEANRQRFNLEQSRFDRLIEWLGKANGMTVEEYRDYVYWCHANPRSIENCNNL